DLLETGVRAVLLKGGHDTGDTVQDWLVTADGEHRFEHPRLPGRYHGTGCTLSAAIAAQRARGEPLHSAVEKSLSYLRTAMRAAGPARCGDLLVLDHGAGVAADGPPDRD
ncbi:MAG: bifunctional hydroxymethylpyrimidine kinase/phosphomethylpyrimidine kinase, partial [Xanthomonadales bacterium]|nr:bifunctional hydroxymethylpyrimidine kinase/phosphomethylpyrimidine kinase [Xanthomonadales bacterium]